MNKEFVPAHEAPRQPHDRKLKLHEFAAYFTAHAVDQHLVDEVETLLIRSFPNDLWNMKMEKFGKAAKRAERAKAGAAATGKAAAKKTAARKAAVKKVAKKRAARA